MCRNLCIVSVSSLSSVNVQYGEPNFEGEGGGGDGAGGGEGAGGEAGQPAVAASQDRIGCGECGKARHSAAFGGGRAGGCIWQCHHFVYHPYPHFFRLSEWGFPLFFIFYLPEGNIMYLADGW